MKKALLIIIAVLLLSISASAQTHFSNLDQVAEAVENKIRSAMEGWDCHQIQPMADLYTVPTGDIKIQHWNAASSDVRIAMQRYSSVQDATNNLRRFAESKQAVSINGLADEAYLHGIESAIVLRKGNLLIFIRAIVDKENDRSVALRNPTARANAERDEEAVLTRTVARHVATLLQTL